MPTPAEELQKALYDALRLDAAVAAVVGDRIHDGRPDMSQGACLTFGPTDMVPDDMDGIEAREEAGQIDVWVPDGGRLRKTKALADKVFDVLHGAELALSTHALAHLVVTLVRVMQDPDGLTGHGIVSYEATVEAR